VYRVDWTPETITWLIDGVSVRSLNYSDAENGTRFPQTPMRLRIGIWAGGDSSNSEGTIAWAGGATNYTSGPYMMTVQRVTVINYSPATSYSYHGTSGSYQSISISGGSLMGSANSTAAYSLTSSNTTSSSSSLSSVSTSSGNAVFSSRSGTTFHGKDALAGYLLTFVALLSTLY
jgi:beta-glucanase (GH16 family)